ncbi:MAG TPA: ABC transporter substrate-binding protein [Clostridium sp.]|nr:ABC transporter substrate-binding protein [Clostridium sp.]
MKKRKIIMVGILTTLFISIQIGILYTGIKTPFSNEKEMDNEIHGSITFVSNRTDKQIELNKLITDFENVYPNVKVKLELMGDAEEILQRKASVGELEDVTVIPGIITNNEFDKYLLPLDNLGFNEEDMYNYNLGVGNDGKLYALTTSLSWQGIIYNKRIFDSLGIENVPETNEEFWNVCEKIKSNNITPIALNYRQSWIMDTWISKIPYLYDLNMEKKLIDKSYNILDSESEIYKSMEFLRAIHKYGYCEKNLIDYEWMQCKSDMVNGNIAMIIWNSDFINQLEDMGMDKNDIDMFPIPETKNIIINGDYRIGISKNTKYPEAAKEFLKFLFEDDRYAKAVNIKSNMKNSNRTAEVIDNISNYNVCVNFDGDLAYNKNMEKNLIHEKFNRIKSASNINYNLVQQYIISADTDNIRRNINRTWSEENNRTSKTVD